MKVPAGGQVCMAPAVQHLEAVVVCICMFILQGAWWSAMPTSMRVCLVISFHGDIVHL